MNHQEYQRELAEKQASQDAVAPAVLHLSVVKAKDLIAADAGGTSDPYVRIHVGKEIANGKKTKTIKKSLNPEWNEVRCCKSHCCFTTACLQCENFLMRSKLAHYFALED